MSSRIGRPLARFAAGLAGFGLAGVVHAGATIKIDDTKWVSVGAGLRTSFNSVEDAAPDDGRSTDFLLDSIRLYLNAQLHEYIKLEFNTERQDTADGDDDIRVLDAIAKFTFMDAFNVWMGRHLPPSDRANLDGPYYLNAWTFPIAQAYPAIFAGRDDGVSVNGSLGGGMFGYAAGVFEGTEGGMSPNQDDNLLYAGRVQLALLDPEPGYYTTSSYFGAKRIFTIGLAAQAQSDGTGTLLDPGDFFGWSADALFEMPLGEGGAFSLEGAYYDYDHDDELPAFGYQGDGFYALASVLVPGKFGIGQFQPHARYQEVNGDGPFSADLDRWEAGLGYVIDGQNAKVILTYGEDDPEFGESTNFVILGVQLQV
jgi:hypothetical protein